MGERCRAYGLRLACLAAAALLAACGAGGAGTDTLGVEGGSAALLGLRVATVDLPPARRGVDYPGVQLEVSEPTGALRWRLRSGALPPGLALEEDGLLAGRPAASGFFAFEVHVTDGLRAGVGRLGLAVDAFGLYAQRGLVGGDAWRGREVHLHAAGQRGNVSFSLLANGSGAQLTQVDTAAGTAVYRAGQAGGLRETDYVRATDLGTGRTADLVLTVRPDPLANHDAEFGSTDVWYVNMERKYGAHPYATDMHAVLAQVGLRGVQGYDMLGSEADELAATWIRLEILRKLNGYYLRNPDGTAGAGGLPVSFPFAEPGPAFRKPPVGTYIDGGSTHFSELSLIEGRSGGVVGTAFVDDAANTLHENNTSRGDERLGVFLNVIGSYFNAVYPHDDVRDEPIGPDDVEALHALLNNLPSPGGRYAQIRQAGRDFARVVATVVAHEIGHSLGLEHTPGPGGGQSIMDASAAISPWSAPRFLAEDLSRLQSRLPGPGRFGYARRAHGPAAAVAASGVPAGGVRTCRRCDLRIAVPGDGR